jgi:hypothetical protein
MSEPVDVLRKALRQIPREILSEPFPQNPDIQEMKAIRSWWQVAGENALGSLVEERDRYKVALERIALGNVKRDTYTERRKMIARRALVPEASDVS